MDIHASSLAGPQTLPHKRLLIVYQPYPEMMRLLRMARIEAARRNCEWELVSVTASTNDERSQSERREELQTFTMAKQMGGVVTQMRASTLLEGIAELLKLREEQGILVNTIMVIEEKASRIFRFFQRQQLAHKLRERLGDKYAIVPIVRLAERSVQRRMTNILKVNAWHIFISLTFVLAAAPVVEIIRLSWPVEIIDYPGNEEIVYLTVCALVAGRYGMLPGLIAVVASFVVQKLLYYPPFYSLRLQDPEDIARLSLFLGAGSIIALFGSRLHLLNQEAWSHAESYKSLLRVHKAAFGQYSVDDAIKVLDHELSDLLQAPLVFFMPDPDKPTRLVTVHDSVQLDPADEQALMTAWQDSRTTGVATVNSAGCRWRFEPLATPLTNLGVLGIDLKDKPDVDAAFGQLFSNIADQTALILERLVIEHVAEDKRVQAEREQLRAMLLSSVSHDLKTPLASIIGSLSVIRSMDDKLTPEQRLMLMNNALDEAQRLDSFITNILDMTRLESGQIEFKKAWVRPVDIMRDILHRLRERLRHHRVVTTPIDSTIMVHIDGMMILQVLQNLLDNAAKYTPPGTEITVSCVVDDMGCRLEVRDRGPGIPDTHLDKIFDKYARLKRQDKQVAGTGLGLAIAKTIMKSQGGDIVATNHPDGGAVFTLSLPEWRYVMNQIPQDGTGKEVA